MQVQQVQWTHAKISKLGMVMGKIKIVRVELECWGTKDEEKIFTCVVTSQAWPRKGENMHIIMHLRAIFE